MNDKSQNQPTLLQLDRGLLRDRIHRLELWLAADRHNCEEDQAHLVEGSRERAYWHHGYLVALRDMLALGRPLNLS
jgi:hypothetical protein